MNLGTEATDQNNVGSHGSIDFPDEVEVKNFTSVDNFILSVDIDSLYFGDERLGNVVAALGSKAIFSFSWMID